MHHSDVIMGTMGLKSPALPLLTQPFIQAQIKENTKAPRYLALCGEFTGDRWIPRSNGQSRGKCFHLMTSSWYFRNVWTHLKGLDAVVLKYVGYIPVIIHQNIISNNFWHHAGYRCLGREYLLGNEKLQFWIESHNIWFHIYQLNTCIALQRIN